MIRRPPRSTLDRSSAASDVYKRQLKYLGVRDPEKLNPRQQTEILLNLLQRPGLLLILDGFERVLRAYSNMGACLLYTSPSPRDRTRSRMPSSA